ncbi:SDR family NAD(P)-dependent oxidoreductase [Aeromicrobium sp. P5_D10]
MSNDDQSATQVGSVFAVTGATAGIGYFLAEKLAATGSEVILMGRSATRIETAKREIRRRVPTAQLTDMAVDLSDLDSVRDAAAALAGRPRLDGLIANAGVISVGKQRMTTVQGHELAVGTNHLGHFALIGAALPLLEATPGSRVVSTGSYITGMIPFDPDDLLSESDFHPRRAYAQSKHATEIFGFELDRRLRLSGSGTSSIIAHPGGALEQMTPRRPGIGGASVPVRAVFSIGAGFAQGKHRGALPLVMAALDPTVTGGTYLGPHRRTHGRPIVTTPPPTSTDPVLGAALWRRSEELTGVTFGTR